MAVTLNASNCPAPVVPNPGVLLSDSNPPPVSDEFATGMASGFTTQLNKQFKRADLMGSWGAGGYGVADGLTLSAGTGLQVAVAAGHAIMDGIVELAASTAVLNASATNWVWLKQDGTLVVQNGVTTKPSGNCVCLGAAVTDGSGVTSIETSGVVYSLYGTFYRQTADTLVPGDSPNASIRIFTKTAGGTYFWDGTAHVQLSPAGSPVTKTLTLSYTDFQTAALTNTVNGLLLPAKALVHSVNVRIATAFSGGSIATMTFEAGITGTTNKYVSGIDGTATGSTPSDGTQYAESDSATTQTVVKATSTGANLSDLAAGSVVVTTVYSIYG